MNQDAPAPKFAATETYCLRRLQPFQGTLQVLECDAGRALSLDGVSWQIQIGLLWSSSGWSSFADPVQESGFVPYCNWNAEGQRRMLPLPPQADRALAKEQAEQVLEELDSQRSLLPFAAGDPFELWLLDDHEQLPLALLDAARQRPAAGGRPAGRWRPFPLHGAGGGEYPHPSEVPLAERAASLVNRRGGSSPSLQWFRRRPDGSGQGLWGRYLRPDQGQRELPADAFPPALLRAPEGSAEQELAAYQSAMAPRLLCLHGLPDALRTRLEQAAWRQPEQVATLYRLYPQVLARDALKVCLVKARLLESGRTT